MYKSPLIAIKGVGRSYNVGGMDAIDLSEHEYHKVPKVDWNDVWEDVPVLTPPVPKMFKKDISYARTRGNT